VTSEKDQRHALSNLFAYRVFNKHNLQIWIIMLNFALNLQQYMAKWSWGKARTPLIENERT
jgi:hypothetical protein